MVGDGICHIECLNPACGNDAGDCDASLCSIGCFPSMIDDGLCEEVCHVEECGWDGKDCDCSPGCTQELLGNDQCDFLCFTENCHFDNGKCDAECSPGCSADKRGDGECNLECIDTVCERDNGDCECAPGCLHSDLGQCKPECQVPECNYDLLVSTTLCLDTSILDCSAVECYDELDDVEIENCDFPCSQCGFEVQYKVSCCSRCCSEHYYPHPAAPSVCVREPDRTSRQRPRLIYIASASSQESVDTAFPSLSAAFDSIFERYVEVRLLAGTHELTSSKYIIDFVPFRISSSRRAQQVEALKWLKLTSQSCADSPENCTRAVIATVDTTHPYFLLSGHRQLEVSNVDFTSSLAKQLCVVGGRAYCMYSIDLFRIIDGMTAFFQNVTFSNFRSSVSSMISVRNAKLVLEHVDFLSIMLHGDIGELGVLTSDSSDVRYTGGRISLTNNLWDYRTLQHSGGAVSAVGSSLRIESVSFANNFMALADKTAQFASLVYVRDCGQVRISNCEFAFNVGRRGAVISIYTYNWKTTSGEYDAAMAILESLVEISNCTFTNNTGTVGTSIYINFLSGQQNILITDCTFLNEFAEANSVIAGTSRPGAAQSKSRGAVTLNGALRTVEYPVPRLTLRRSQFRNCNVGLFGLIALENMWNVRVERVTIEEVPAGDARNSSTNSLDVLTTIPGASLPRSRPSASPQHCESLLNFTAAAALEIEFLSITHANCSNVVTASGASVSIRSSYFAWSRGSALHGFVLSLGGKSVTLQGVVVEGNASDSPHSSGTVYLASRAASISHSRFAFNTASQGAALYLANVQRIELRASTFEHNSADTGGAVFVEGSGAMALQANSSVFRNNSAASYGGAISVVASGHLNARVAIEHSVFDRCLSKIGSAIFTSEGVVFQPGTLFKACTFTENVSELYGTCAFQLVSGEATFTSTRFERNVGTYTSALFVSYSPAPTTHLLTLTDTLFHANEAANVVSIVSTASPLHFVGTATTCRSNTGTCFYLDSVHFTCSDCEFSLNSAVSGAALQLHSSVATCANCDFRSNSAELAGGAVLARSYSQFVCRRCDFSRNTSQWKGGALFTEQSNLVLDATAFTFNRARSGGSAFFSVLSDQQSAVRSSRFAFNEGTDYGCVNLISAFLELHDCDFAENSSAGSMSGLVLSQSVVDIAHCRFANQTGTSGVFAFVISSTVTVSHSLLLNGTAASTGAGMSFVSSQVTISSCEFQALFSAFGGAVAAQDGSSVTLENCSFQRITSKAINRGVLVMLRSALHLSYSSLSSYNQGGVYGLQASVTVVGSSFVNGTGTLGGGVACTSCESFEIRNCSFERLAADRGVAIYLEGSREPDHFRISDSEFRHCEGTFSGAVHVEEFPGSIDNCVFRANTGRKGGAIYIAKSSLFPSPLTIAANRFTSNSASRRGGAICWEGSQPVIQGNDFSGNTATYGVDIASYAVKTSLTRESYPSLVNATSGKPLPLVLDLLDTYGQVVADDDESIAQLKSDDDETVVSGEVRVQARRGQFFFTDCFVTAKPGANASISVSTSVAPSKEDFFVLMRYCAKGEREFRNTCVPCAPGTYSLTNHSDCANCPPHAYCLGNFTIAPKAGYWRPSAATDSFLQCSNAEACLGSPDGTYLTGACADGYEGVKCQACAHGYYQWGSVYCSECWSTSARVGIHVFVSTLLISAVGVLVGLVVQHDSKLLLYIKVFANHAQATMLFRCLGLAWPRNILLLFNAYEVFGAFPEYVLSANCVMRSYYGKLLAMALTQPALASFALLIWGLVALVKRSGRYLLDEFVSTVVAITFLSHTSVVRTMLDLFHCEEIEGGKYWLVAHNIQCWTPRHKQYAFGLALPCLILSGFALPVLTLVFLQHERRHHQAGGVRFRYVLLGYPHSRWHWEFVMLCWRGLVAACFALLFAVSKLFPALSVFGSVIVLIGVLRSGDPLEVQSLYVCVATLYSGLMLHTGVLGSTAREALFGVVLSLNVYFASAFAWRVAVFLYQQAKKRTEQLSENRE